MARIGGLPCEDAEELAQDVLRFVFEKLPSFKKERKAGSFGAWLLQLTKWRVKDRLRRIGTQRKSGVAADCSESEQEQIHQLPAKQDTDIDGHWDREWEQGQFNQALSHLKKTLTAKQFQIFDYAVLQEWPAKKVAAVLGIKVAEVYSTKHRTQRMFEQVLRRLRDDPF